MELSIGQLWYIPLQQSLLLVTDVREDFVRVEIDRGLIDFHITADQQKLFAKEYVYIGELSDDGKCYCRLCIAMKG